MRLWPSECVGGKGREVRRAVTAGDCGLLVIIKGLQCLSHDFNDTLILILALGVDGM